MRESKKKLPNWNPYSDVALELGALSHNRTNLLELYECFLFVSQIRNYDNILDRERMQFNEKYIPMKTTDHRK